MPNIDFIESKSTSFEAIEWRPPIFIRWIIAKFFSRVIFFNQGGGRPIQKISIDNFKKWVNRNSPSFRLKIWKTDLKKNRKSTFFSSWEKYAEEDPGEPFRRRRNFVGQKRKYNIKKRRHITCIKDKRKSWKFLRRVAVVRRNGNFNHRFLGTYTYQNAPATTTTLTICGAFIDWVLQHTESEVWFILLPCNIFI